MTTEGLEEYVIVKQSEYILSEWREYGCKYLIASKRGAVKLLFTYYKFLTCSFITLIML